MYCRYCGAQIADDSAFWAKTPGPNGKLVGESFVFRLDNSEHVQITNRSLRCPAGKRPADLPHADGAGSSMLSGGPPVRSPCSKAQAGRRGHLGKHKDSRNNVSPRAQRVHHNQSLEPDLYFGAP